MPNKSSPHGAAIIEGTVSHGTLRQQDLLRAFSAELTRYLPFNGAKLSNEASELAERLDTIEATDSDIETAGFVLEELTSELETIASREGFYFGTLEGDGSDFGFWRVDDESED